MGCNQSEEECTTSTTAGTPVKLVMVVSFKKHVTERKIDEFIKKFDDLKHNHPERKAFHWIRNQKNIDAEPYVRRFINPRFTHFAESTFSSVHDLQKFHKANDTLKFFEEFYPATREAIGIAGVFN
ncbi:hypothetical protein Tsubulata_047255 [Turnera subulata]|uniref:Stress-response A/B barrel domain-containing protein n=1 Tax=Turnera subulata TaxID=218843 RepID=A0A9Q0J726_9ROSI|nr:hypothetical protein Tsubulata_047255 [Turnera subulata]